MQRSISQQQAVEHQLGPMLVLAGPGSGKTSVVAGRVQYLIEKHGVNPGTILVITFTKAAAREMKERFLHDSLGGLPSSESANSLVSFGTFHAVFFRILQYSYQYRATDLIRDSERYSFLREQLYQRKMNLEAEQDFMSLIFSEISKVKNGGESLHSFHSVSCSQEVFAELYTAYQQMLRTTGRIDFDDMLVLCYELFGEHPDILALWQEKFQYILVDEFQDCNRLQYEIVRQLAGTRKNVFVVGDDDQSIYGFRGARPSLMKTFLADFSPAPTVLLDRNYRCARQISEHAGRVINHNKGRFAKRLCVTEQAAEGIFEVRRLDDAACEMNEILHLVRTAESRGIPLSEQAVLYRTNTQPRVLITRLIENEIPFIVHDKLPNLFEHWIAADFLAYIRLSLGEMKRSLLLEVCNRPKRYLSRSAFSASEIVWQDVIYFYRDKPYVAERIERLKYDLAMLRKMPPYAGVNYIRKAIGYDGFLEEYAERQSVSYEELLEIASEIQESARDFKTYEDWITHIETLGKRWNTKQERPGIKRFESDAECLSLMTFHASKGLEFRLVIIMDVNEGICPHRKAELPTDLEEERRTFYVAMTRAKEELYLLVPRERYGRSLPPSRFIKELGAVYCSSSGSSSSP